MVEPKNVTKPEEAPVAEAPEKAEERLKKALADAKSTEEYRAVAQDSLKVFDQAASGGQTDLSKRMASLALTAARKAHDNALAEDASASLITGKRRPAGAEDEEEEESSTDAANSINSEKPSHPGAAKVVYLDDLQPSDCNVKWQHWGYTANLALTACRCR